METAEPLLPQGESWDDLCDGFEWDIPANFTIHEACCFGWAERAPDRLALIDLSTGHAARWTFGDIAKASRQLASVLAQEGVSAQDRVAILLGQQAEVLISHFATMALGAISLPLFTLFGPDALAYRLQDSRAKVLVTDAAGAAKLSGLDLPDLQAVLVVEPERAGTFWKRLTTAPPLPSLAQVGRDDPAMMIYTSGTTGPPKGVLHAHRFLMGHMPSIELTHRGFGQTKDVGWTPADWAWIGGLMDMAMPCLLRAVPLVALRMTKFDPEAAYELIRAQSVTRLFLPPTAMKMMAQVDPNGASAVSISSGGESLGEDIRHWAQAALGAEVNELYGQTECNLTVSSSACLGGQRKGAMGRAVAGVSLTLRDPRGAKVGVGEIGEICVHHDTPAMFLTYWEQPEKTAAKFHNTDTGRWLRTGDLATQDADGFITYVARDDDLISSAGYRIGPSEIEACLTQDGDVVMAAAVGVPDPVRGAIVVAHVTLRKGADVTGLEGRLIALVKTRISPHVAPKRIVVRDAMPLTATGKIMRRSLRDER